MSISVSTTQSGITAEAFEKIEKKLIQAHQKLYDATGQGNDFLGWVNWPVEYDKHEFIKIRDVADKIRSTSEVFLVIGIGGSYLGSKAAIDALNGNFFNELDSKSPRIYFVGNNLSAQYLQDILHLIEKKDICVNVISKSGTTTEPAVAFRIIKQFMENKYGKQGAASRIFATTDRSKGALKKMSDFEGYETFQISDDIGGRYSVITAVGLLPMAVAGIDIEKFMSGVADGFAEYKEASILKNEAFKYAAYRNILYQNEKKIEILVNYEPSMIFLSEWWKQLFGESEGKEGRGIFPASVNFTADLHSMGQYIQEGERHIFETVIQIKKSQTDMVLPYDEKDLDGLNYIAGKSISYINEKALQGTSFAHVDGGVPNCLIEIDEMNAFNLGKLMYFFMISCGISGYLLGVNPFNQPGVEAYKKNMFALLGKEGFDDLKKTLLF
jgi:glucose-6-phosphate isomerase